MRRTVLSLLLSVPIAIPCVATEAPKPPMAFGVFYYPEQWPKAQWKRDLDHIAQLGFTFTHFAEFAWTYLEPSEGRYDFAWLDEALDLADKAGLKVILCTPSPAPPSWMGHRYPDIYRVDERGQRHEHGIRAEVSLTHPIYRAKLAKLVTALAKRYGKDPRVMGWQVDNEPGATPDFSPSARKAFQTWLKARYGTVEKLNEVWGGSFWSSRYGTWAEVLLPNATLAAEDKLSPHALVDLARFQADTTAIFLDEQARILKAHVEKRQWVTTNYTNVTTGVDPRRTKALDFTTFTIYPIAGANVLGGESFALGHPLRMAEACDYHRNVAGRFGVMELQPGQVNWASVNPLPQPQTLNMWLWHAFAGGADFVSTYRYRHPLRGSEMYHDGIVGTDGVTLSPGGKGWVQAMEDLKRITPKLQPGAPLPQALAARRTGFLWSHDTFWDLEAQPQTTAWKTWAHRNTWTSAVYQAAAPLDFIRETDDFTRWPFLVAPAFQMVDPALAQKWRAYAEGGGHLVLTCRTGQKNALGHFHEAPWAAPILDLIGADVEAFDMLPPGVKAKVKAGSDTFTWNAWADLLVPRSGTEVLATYADRFYAGKAAAVTRRLGKGSVSYIGVWTEDGELERRLLRDVYTRAGVAVEELPKGVHVRFRDGVHVGVNYTPKAVTLSVPTDARILLGTQPVAPGSVLVWKVR